MRRFAPAALLLLFFLAKASAGPVEFLSPDELKPGMKGYGRTVFSGAKVETFDAEILGVLKNAYAKRDVIIARLSGGPLEKTKIIAGMSGSPVYVDGKMIGAVAFTWDFLQEPLAGITPIGDMLAAMEGEPKGEAAAGRPGGEAGPSGMAVIQTPIAVSGLGPQALEILKPLFQETGALLVQGGSTGEGEAAAPELEPGSSIGIALARGDIGIYAIGTLTYRDGDKVFAFGHPFSMVGETELPLIRTFVQTLVPKQDVSFKLAAQVGEPVGAITQDRPTAVAGYLGKKARMSQVEVSVKASSPSGEKSREYRFEAVRDKRWFSSIAMAGAGEAVSEVLSGGGDWMVKVEAEAFYGDEGRLRLGNVYYTSGFSALPVLGVLSGLAFVQENPFQEVNFDRLKVRIEAVEGRKTAFINSAAMGKLEYAPGEEVKVTATLIPYDGGPQTVDLSFELPKDAAPGAWLTANVCDARASDQLEVSRGPGRFRPKDFDHLMELVQKETPNDHVFVRVLVPVQGLTLSGDAFPSLPSSVMPVIGAPGRPGVEPMSSEIAVSKETQWYVSGNLVLRFRVSDRGVSE